METRLHKRAVKDRPTACWCSERSDGRIADAVISVFDMTRKVKLNAGVRVRRNDQVIPTVLVRHRSPVECARAGFDDKVIGLSLVLIKNEHFYVLC
jgi:hypothetical protein